MASEKTGIYTMTGKNGNLRNVINGEMVLTEGTQEELDSELYRYLQRLKGRKPSEYLYVKGKER